jgi:dihydrofolate reductase
MGKLIVTEFVTLDGVAQAPGGPDEDRDGGFPLGGWQVPLLDQESGGTMFEEAQSMDALLLGRKTYEIFAAYWPKAPEEIPFTGLLNRVPKYVASRTLSDPLAWQGTTLLAGGTVPTALRLTESVTWPNGTLQLTYETAGAPTYGNLAIEADDLQRLDEG